MTWILMYLTAGLFFSLGFFLFNTRRHGPYNEMYVWQVAVSFLLIAILWFPIAAFIVIVGVYGAFRKAWRQVKDEES